jgi:hypothetical protein
LRQRARDGRVEHRLAVGALHSGVTQLAVAGSGRQCLGGRLDHRLVVAVREQRAAAPLDVEDETAVQQ